MRQPRTIVVFLCSFVLVYGLLILPWPGWNRGYSRYLQALGRTVFVGNGDRRILRFSSGTGLPGSLDTRITLANRDLLDHTGSGSARILQLDARGIGWVPTALLVALILATPIPWRRRGWALFWGLLSVHVFILFSLGIYIWDESTELSLVALTPFWKTVADGLEETLITQLGASFVVPALIWILVTFSRQDLDRLSKFWLATAERRGPRAPNAELRTTNFQVPSNKDQKRE
jgi:hypothetical protein